jgi:hypothetical protein
MCMATLEKMSSLDTGTLSLQGMLVVYIHVLAQDLIDVVP